MKKSVVFIVLFLFIAGISAQAQLKFGLKAGVNLANASLKGNVLDNLKTENLTGFQVGPMLNVTIPIFGLGFDAAVLYSQDGFKYKSASEAAGEIYRTYKLNTLEVPVNLKYKLTLFKLIGAYATAGPYINFKLSDNLKTQFEDKTFGAGLNFGVGIELLNHLQIGVNYRNGLTDDYSKIKVAYLLPSLETGKLEGKTTTWSVTAAYLF
ncbi:MAG: porin family protein [Dysgonamonadaceae bacterium]|nr:porin family protein [Dysgonamonadaceae bacterium]